MEMHERETISDVEAKLAKASKLEAKLKGIAAKALLKGDYNKALAAIAACGGILYDLNQKYTDAELEDYLLVVSAELVDFSEPWKEHEAPVVLYYDRFGLDLRGLAIANLDSILANGYRLHYVTSEHARGKQPHIGKVLDNPLAVIHYIDFTCSYMDCIDDLASVFREVQPTFAYIYTMPDDVVGISVFNALAGKCTRALPDLTDHAFWLGVNSFDFCLNNRDMGQGIERFERRIPREKLLRSAGPSLYVIEDADGGAWPFDPAEHPYVFSGGSLYKTLGGPGNAYYRIVDHIVSEHEDIVFWYAGEGDASEIEKLQARYPGRIFHTEERSDFYQIIEGCILYLNTYPMFGGMMMRYAARAGKIPVTLRHDSDADGILRDQAAAQVEYDTVDELLDDIDLLLTDPEYRNEREAKLEGCVVMPEEYARYVKMLIEEHRTEYPCHFEPQDTTSFRSEFLERFDIRAAKANYIARRQNFSLLPVFPSVFAGKAFKKVIRSN